MTTTTEAENTKLRKGDKALWVRSYARNGVCTFSVAPIEITSWGAKQGTAIGPTSGKNALVRFYTDQNPMRGQWVFKNMAEIEAFAAQYGPQWAETSRKGSLNCEESNFNNLRPQYREAAAARIAELRAMVPRYEIKQTIL